MFSRINGELRLSLLHDIALSSSILIDYSKNCFSYYSHIKYFETIVEKMYNRYEMGIICKTRNTNYLISIYILD